VLAHGHDLGDNRLVGPLNTENLGELLQVLCRGLTDRENGVAQPAHAQAAELLIEELDAKLRGKKRDVFDDGQTNAPLLVFRKLNNSGEEGLRKKLDANDYLTLADNPYLIGLKHTIVNRLKLRDDVQSDIRELVLEHLQKHGKKMWDGLFLPKNGREATDLGAESGANVLW
jgi:hypothetical protein